MSLKERWASILKTRSLFRLGIFSLSKCVWTHTSWGGKASIALWLLMSRLPLQQTHRHFHPLSVSHTVSAAVQGPARSLLSLSYYGVSLFCALSGVEGDWCFYIGPKHFSGVCKYIFFRAMIMWHIWSGTPFVKVHKRLCAPGRLMKQTCRAARITCALHLKLFKTATITL